MKNSPFIAHGLPRRRSLLGLGALSALALASGRRVWAQPAPAAGRTLLDGGRLVVVFLRGAYDGLSAFVPYADRDYYAIRPNIAIPAPDGSAQTSLRLDGTFAMHPALSPLLPLWQQGVLGFVPAAGLPAPNRSHFDAQYQMEIARTGKTSSAPGWLNTVAELNAGGTTGDSSAVAIGVGEANPVILGGPAPVRLIPRGQTAEKTGVLANDKTRHALLDLYGGNDSISTAFRQGADSRMQSAQELSSEKGVAEARRDMATQPAQRMPDRGLDRDGAPANLQMPSAQMVAASNGAPDPVGLQLDAQHLGTLMRNDRKLRLGFLSAGGWDSHANQGAVTGQLANNLGNLARGIAQLRQVFSEPGDIIVVMSEFGRTSAENGTRGTDHGFGNALWLIGNRVAGGRWHGDWTGLASGNLNDARDLPAHHDYRAVLAQVLRASFSLGDSQLASILPDTRWDSRLDGMLRKA
ncbi:DUF1501 domain-containing protein [Polaromonas sp.]|uniref:DUF1501 domain-containing protein n=1 Tax=Polaromonas sp. TaxID=1869339 RepID=UPI0013BCF4A7|nr:DUF1501 domain-containing protein [Polaromonas sp.]NDP61942.1 DUF1501 domain-containing protein [Polaromonas sp.]